MPEPSLAMLQTLMERMIEGQRQTNDGQRQIMNRLERVERAVLAGQRLLLDRSEADTDMQHQIDTLVRRVEALESR